jgi:DNA-binding FadR family transcriptional regulator
VSASEEPLERIGRLELDIASSVLRAVRTRNAYEETVERLLQIVKLGIVRYGERLPPERELAERLGVSRVTLREGIRSLQLAGYLESRRGRFGGTFVVYRPTADKSAGRLGAGSSSSVEDVLALRQVVEPGVVELVATKELTDQQKATLRRRLQDVSDAQPDGYRQADARLHLSIAELTGSAMITRTVADVRMALNDLLGSLPSLQPPLDHSNEQHAQMVDAILEHDPHRARELMVEHLEATAALLRGFLS